MTSAPAPQEAPSLRVFYGRVQRAPELEYHSEYQLTFVTEGRGACQIGNTLYPFEPGDVLMIRPSELHRSYGEESRSFMAYEALFDERATDCFSDIKARPEMALLLAPWSGAREFSPKLSLRGDDRRTMDVLMRQLHRAAAPAQPLPEGCRRNIQAGLLCAVLAFLGEASGADYQPHAEQAGDPMIAKAQRYIQQHYDDELTLETIARYLYVSPTYLSRVFRRATGLSIVTYINQKRVDQARCYLSDTAMPVTRVATTVGFNSVAYFSTVFKGLTGLSPNAYRAQAKARG